MYFAFLGTTEIIIILVIALIVFGPQKLPEIGRQVGSAMRELQRVRSDVQRALDIDEYTRLDLPSYETPTYGSTYTYDADAGHLEGSSSVYDSPVNRDFVPPPGPAALQTASLQEIKPMETSITSHDTDTLPQPLEGPQQHKEL
jgi:sec-independent protein translocase protein TatA